MKTLGIVAGFGPYAATYFIKRLLVLTDAKKEWDQFPMIAYYNTQIPSRTRALLYGESSPAPKLIDTINTLKKAKADFIAVPCNSSHGWYDEVSKKIDIDWLNIIRVTSEAVKRERVKKALVIGAYVPTKLKLYNKYLENVVYPKKSEMDVVYQLIEKLKINEDRKKIKKEFWNLLEHYRGDVDGIVIACTEPSMMFDINEKRFGPFKIIDSTHEYAKKCVDMCKE